MLDEPTSALDVETEKQILDYLFNTYTDRTILIILHNMREISRFDKVLMLKDGEVAGYGTHDDLLSGSEAYRLLYFSEMKKDQEGE